MGREAADRVTASKEGFICVPGLGCESRGGSGRGAQSRRYQQVLRQQASAPRPGPARLYWRGQR